MSNLSQVNPVRMGPTVDRIGVVDSLRGAALFARVALGERWPQYCVAG